eukprot:TRINITY_DN11920_c0_g1_i1.p1 TRINITY_DN11920_c0_g1~~TRINITY_DN11920_c0_g1_i1.p1  ORF type:complete len:120 (-),score=32.53 TRINITY_DN11920_c0_g1_i1:55-414(-)
MYSVVARFTRPAGVRTYRAAPAVAAKSPTQAWDDREKTAEDADVKGHEQRLVAELAAKIQAKQAASSSQVDLTEQVDLHRQDLESHILSLRKELLQEINEAKDEIAELKFRIKRLESRK